MLILICFIWENQLFEDLLLFSFGLMYTQGEEVFSKIDQFLKQGINWEKHVGITSDGAASLSLIHILKEAVCGRLIVNVFKNHTTKASVQ